VFDKLPTLFAYGLSWCELRCGEDANSTRRETDPRWSELSVAWGPSKPQMRIRRKAQTEAEERAAQRMYSALTTLAAYSVRDDLLSTAQWGLWRCERLIKERGLDFAKDTQAKRARIVSDGEVPF
jgi:hypothetical protein